MIEDISKEISDDIGQYNFEVGMKNPVEHDIVIVRTMMKCFMNWLSSQGVVVFRRPIEERVESDLEFSESKHYRIGFRATFVHKFTEELVESLIKKETNRCVKIAAEMNCPQVAEAIKAKYKSN